MYRDRAVHSIRWFAGSFLNGTLSDASNHCYEPLSTYKTLIDSGVDPYADNSTLLLGLKKAMIAQCADLKPDHRGTEAVSASTVC